MTSLNEEAEVKKNNKSSNQAKKVTGQSDKKSEGMTCYKCGSSTHMKKECPEMHGMVCGWCSKKFHTEDKCFSKQHGKRYKGFINLILFTNIMNKYSYP